MAVGSDVGVVVGIDDVGVVDGLFVSPGIVGRLVGTDVGVEVGLEDGTEVG
jgi:hypothetical protein